MTVTALLPRRTPKRQFISKTAPALQEPKPEIGQPVMGKGRRTASERKRKRKRVALHPPRV